MNRSQLVFLRILSLSVHAVFLYEGLTTRPNGCIFGLVDRFLSGFIVGATAMPAILLASVLVFSDRNWGPVHLLCLGMDVVMLIPLAFPFLPLPG